ncbi:MAG: hypothetical protein CO093_05125 [Alphaproteobacteria bacterium CG_4_9_14_3_um_filter_47_13]|nr:MAG: hypothetical protein CO093_05125 [Alphaproteobacteria bacterium CG_4_9_14_3_um_filter_47_13]
MTQKDHYTPKSQAEIETIPFVSAEEAWFWFIQAQQAREEGARFAMGLGLYPRPCEPLDILKILDRLYRKRELRMDHALVLRHYGRRLLPPDPDRIKERRAHQLWIEALGMIEMVLVSKGLVHPPVSCRGHL